MIYKQQLIIILKKAMSLGIKKPSVPEWAKGTYYEQQITIPDDIEKDLMKIFAKIPELEVFNDRLFHMGWGASRVNYKKLASWLISRTLEIGAENTVNDLEKYSEMKETPAYQVRVINGIEVVKEVELIKGISLIPFENVPESWGKNFINQQRLFIRKIMSPFVPMQYNENFVYASAALLRKISISPKSYKQGENSFSSTPDQEDLYDVCDCLTLIGPSAPVPVGFWGALEDWVPCSGLLGSGLGYSTYYDMNIEKSYHYKNGDYEIAKNIINQYFALNINIRNNLRTPLKRLNQSLRRINDIDKFIDLAIALEALLLHKIEDKEQLSFTFSLRGAWLLGRNTKERKDNYDLLRDIYKARSMAVHSGKINEKKLKMSPQDLFNKGVKTCVTIIKGVIVRGTFPDWNNLIFGEKGI
jgi:hypothetical protein